ncbi:MAG: cell wall metabolism sensor histidine kinase WalK [Chloroflexota bacterium]|nr:cell wall metabolism sensor histidine kinase WalK [Chloroflexota bacterium]
MSRSILWRIAIPYGVLILLAMAGLGVYLSQLVRDEYMADLQNQLLQEARLVADALESPLAGSETGADFDLLAQHYAHLLDARFTIIGTDGTVLGESHGNRLQMDNHLDRPEVQQALATGQGSIIRASETEGYEMLFMAVPVRTDERLAGIVRVALPLRQIADTVAQLRITVLAATLLLMLVATSLGLLIAERIARPVRRLTSAAHAMERGELQEETIASLQATKGRDEISVLAQVFGQMADQVRMRERALRQQVQHLRIEIDEIKQTQQVSEITETDYFRQLQERARAMRQKPGNE